MFLYPYMSGLNCKHGPDSYFLTLFTSMNNEQIQTSFNMLADAYGFVLHYISQLDYEQ